MRSRTTPFYSSDYGMRRLNLANLLILLATFDYTLLPSVVADEDETIKETRATEEVSVGVDGEIDSLGSTGVKTTTVSTSEVPSRFGVDYSWPIHTSKETDPDFSFLPPHRANAYKHFMKGCTDQFEPDVCWHNEEDRIRSNYLQPPEQTNFTSAGYAKMKIPEEIFDMLTDFWLENRKKRTLESWPPGNIYVNHWDSSTFFVPIEKMDWSKKKQMVFAIQEILEAWSGTDLEMTSLYGIRIYNRASILAPHVDRLPLVISAIMNVDQDVDEDWILEVIDHSGEAVNITMEPGDLVLYESHSVIHGRPYALKGDYYANVFMHFEPIGYTESMEWWGEEDVDEYDEDQAAERDFDAALASLTLEEDILAEESASPSLATLPPYILEGSLEASQWRQEYAFVRNEEKDASVSASSKKQTTKTDGATSAHTLAAKGDLNGLKELAKKNPASLTKPDANGWQPLHEAARSGHADVIEYLVEQGVDINARTNNNKGASPLWWAEHMLVDNHPAIRALRRFGAQIIAPHE